MAEVPKEIDVKVKVELDDSELARLAPCVCGSPRPVAPSLTSLPRSWECGWCGRLFYSGTYGGWVEIRGPVKR